MRKGLFAGTFDPPTVGHVDIIRRAALLCDRLYVGVASNSGKNKPMFSLVERKKRLVDALKEISNVEIVSFEGLVVDYAREQHIDILFRALRPGTDPSSEYTMAIANRQMGGLETLFLVSDPRYAFISSSLVREILAAGGDPKGFVV